MPKFSHPYCSLPVIIISFVLIVGATYAEQPFDTSSLSDRLRDGPGMRNHRIGMKPSNKIKIPDGWPLAYDGSITCLTCHEKLPAFGNRRNPRLRATHITEQGGNFCSNCHVNSTGSNQQLSHWSVLGRAHQSTRQSNRNSLHRELDGSSRQCLGCHDGVNASNTTNRHASKSSISIGGNRGEHPIGVRYQRQRSRKQYVSLRHPSQLPKEILLPKGQVSCISCHDLYAPTPARLVIPIEKSALCFACHPMND